MSDFQCVVAAIGVLAVAAYGGIVLAGLVQDWSWRRWQERAQAGALEQLEREHELDRKLALYETELERGVRP